jgi:glutathione S-transferase
MPHYKLHYFNIRARGELPRLMFAAAGVAFEDHRIEFKDWPAQKPKFPFEQIPVLEVDGKFIPQSNAIVLHIAEAVGLAGKNASEKTQCIVISETLKDLVGDIGKFGMKRTPAGPQLNPEPDAEILKTYLESFKKMLALLEKYVHENLTKEKFLVGKELTFVDLGILVVWDSLEFYPFLHFPELLAAHPTLVEHRKHISELPRVKEYLAKRPQNPF